jgi:hypothetical protein
MAIPLLAPRLARRVAEKVQRGDGHGVIHVSTKTTTV